METWTKVNDLKDYKLKAGIFPRESNKCWLTSWWIFKNITIELFTWNGLTEASGWMGPYLMGLGTPKLGL